MLFKNRIMKIKNHSLWSRKGLASALLLVAVGCKSTSYLASDTSFGQEKGDKSFSIAVLPDTQYYTAERHGGTMEMFFNQINWIIGNQKKENIAYVIHLGDITDHNTAKEWDNAKDALYRLDDKGIPYGLTVGNHDETPNGNPALGADTTLQTKYFGRSHFVNKPWYGGTMGNNENNDNHFDLFEANGQKFLAMYFVFNQEGHKKGFFNPDYQKKTLHWADSVLSRYADRKAIMVTHSMLNRAKDNTESGPKPGTGNLNSSPELTAQGKAIYKMAKHHPNVFLMLGGHIGGEAFRKDTFQGNVIKTYLTDYQARQNPPYRGSKDRNGGDGTMRLMRFNTSKQTLSVVTFTPKADGSVVAETDADSQFTQALYQ